MSTYLDFFEELDDNDLTNRLVHKNRKPKGPPPIPKILPPSEKAFLRAQDDSRANFNFTYKAARFEAGWLLDSLGEFYEHKWISDVLRRVKGGKEASVYLCRAGTEVNADFIAAKVYRPRMLRNLKNDSAYREGRIDLNEDGNSLFKDADVHAMEKRTAYGEELRHTSWIAHEFTTLQALQAAGADVPEPYTMTKNSILMGYIGDLDGCAPALSEISLDRAEARSLFEHILHNVDLLLANDRIHGDLSAYNILYWDGDITLIDFPQVVSPQGNRNAFSVFQRDVTRVCEYFSKQGVNANPRQIAADLWKKHGHRIGPEIHPGLLDADDERDRALWQKQKRDR
jgi:RIO kinase 1